MVADRKLGKWDLGPLRNAVSISAMLSYRRAERSGSMMRDIVPSRMALLRVAVLLL